MAKAVVRHPAAAGIEPPPWVADAVARLTAHLEGKPEDLSAIPLDMTRVPPFFRRVYEEARAVPRGQVCTYAELAALAGSPLAMRAVGQAMAKNPWPVVVPCHRVVGSAGKPGGFSAAGGLDTKARLLALEGAPLLFVGTRRLKTRPPAS
jgi:methylated-DNA-[protein]-cysteine S-methyltransferase